MFRLSLVIGFVIALLLPSLRADTASSTEFLPRSGTKLGEGQSILLETLQKDAAGLGAKLVTPELHAKVGSSSVEKISHGGSESVQKSSDPSRGHPSKGLGKEEASEKSSDKRSSKTIKNTWTRLPKSSEEGSEFSYANPEDWSLDYPECAGQQQSPINLDFDSFIQIKNPSDFLFWTNYWNYPISMSITNNGHTVELSGTWAEGAQPFISGGPLEDDYLFAQLHFHWGPTNSVGSEHRFNNHSLSMELHLLHYKREYGNSTNAQKYADGLAVFSILYEVGIANPAVSFLREGLGEIQDTSNPETSIKPFPLALFSPRSPTYITYAGSLTTPPCLEIVTWLVSDIPASISSEQLKLFRKISSNWPVHKNYRPLQALNDRDIWHVTY